MGGHSSNTLPITSYVNYTLYGINNSSSLETDDSQKEQQLRLLQENCGDGISIWIQAMPYSVETSLTDSLSTTVTSKPKYDNIIVDQSDINQFINLVDITCLESGYYSEAERYILSLCETRGYPYVLHLMNIIYTKHPRNELLMCSMINILSHIDYDKLGDFVITLCMAMTFVGTPLIWEYVINACDSWNSMDFIDCLEAIKTDSILLKRMIKKVIMRIKSRNERE